MATGTNKKAWAIKSEIITLAINQWGQVAIPSKYAGKLISTEVYSTDTARRMLLPYYDNNTASKHFMICLQWNVGNNNWSLVTNTTISVFVTYAE